MDKLLPYRHRNLAHLSDDELLASTRRLVGATNQILAALLTHLAEVEVRGIHRSRACASLYTYCVYELRFSEDAAARRSSAAKLVKRFPLLIEAVARGELHLTGLLQIGPILTPENHVEVIARAKFRTKKMHTLDNLTLHCHAHNELAAELDFGAAHIAVRKQENRHASLRSQSSSGGRDNSGGDIRSAGVDHVGPRNLSDPNEATS